MDKRVVDVGAWAAVVLGGAFLFSGCGEGAVPEGKQAREGAEPIVEEAERGPVSLRVTADSEFTLAERLEVTIEVTAADGVDVAMPDFGALLSEFSIRDYRTYPAKEVDVGRRWRQAYELDVFVSGAYTIPSIEVWFKDGREHPEAPTESYVKTEPFEVRALSLMEGEFDPTAFRDVKGPVSLPESGARAWARLVAAGVGGAALLSLVVFWLMRRMRGGAVVEAVAAHEWALDELQKLADEKLVEQGEVHEFYFRLSMILRRYIELRFGLMAPEWTTEEFLVEVQRQGSWQGVRSLPRAYREMLGEFLRACDMVKFALYEPGTGEIEQAFNAARDFVLQTAETVSGDSRLGEGGQEAEAGVDQMAGAA